MKRSRRNQSTSQPTEGVPAKCRKLETKLEEYKKKLSIARDELQEIKTRLLYFQASHRDCSVSMAAADPLPPEMMFNIFSHMDTDTLITAGQVCKRWRAMARDKHMWQNRDLEQGAVAPVSHGEKAMFHTGIWELGSSEDESALEDASKDNQLVELRKRREELRTDPAVTTFLRTLISAPVLRKVTLSYNNEVCCFKKSILGSKCKVQKLSLTTAGTFPNEPKTCWLVDVLKRWSPSLTELSIQPLYVDFVSVIDAMPSLKVLHISSTRNRSRWGSTLPVIRVPIFAKRDPSKSTLVELAANGKNVSVRTVCSLLNAHRRTLESVALFCRVTATIIHSLRQCQRLNQLRVRCQPGMEDHFGPENLPALRRLHLVVESCRKDLPLLANLPAQIQELHLHPASRGIVLRDVEFLAKGCAKVPALKTVVFHNQTSRHGFHGASHCAKLREVRPDITVTMIDD